MLVSCRKQCISIKSAGLSVFRIIPFKTPQTSEKRSEALFVFKQHTGTTYIGATETYASKSYGYLHNNTSSR